MVARRASYRIPKTAGFLRRTKLCKLKTTSAASSPDTSIVNFARFSFYVYNLVLII